MKSSPFRKRYIVVHSENLSLVLREIEATLRRVFRTKRKYMEGDYCIFLTNQYYKDQFINYVRDNMDGVETLITSGSMKKCKHLISEIRKSEVIRAR